MDKKQLGQKGERLAEDYLKKKGYKIIDRNFRIRGGEIDLIALYKEKLIFIEVKTRTSTLFGIPEESIGYHKIEFIKRASQFYLLAHLNLPQDIQIDVVAVQFNSSNYEIRHLESVTS